MEENTTQVLRGGTLLDGGKYRIDAVLGQGGFGVTYLATDLSLDRKVAIKEFFMEEFCFREGTTSHVTLGTEGSRATVELYKAKFLKEARNIAKFDHPGIIKIHAAFEENNTAYYVMEYIEGQPLSSIVKKNGPLAEALAVKIISQVGEALEYIHARRINHLDVKPANIMVRYSGEPVLIDFGLSKQYDSEGQQTSTTPVGLSHGFAPWEQYKPGGVGEFTPATDIYSLAATLYYVLSGKVPPQAPDLVEEELPFPPSIPRRLVAPIRKAMSNARKSRHASVTDFVGELTVGTKPEPQSEPQPQSVPQPNPQPVPQPNPEPELDYTPKTNNIAKIVFASVAIVIVGLAVWFSLPRGAADDSGATVASTDPSDDSGATVAPTDPSDADGSISGHGYVDLGLPSGLKWATCNVGASSPSDYGNYYAWGETSTKSEYTEYNSKTYGYTMGGIGGNSAFDAARANWGGSWRLPTRAEFDELLDQCTLTWTSQDGHEGYLVKGPNGRSIFFPIDSYQGYYWSSTPDSTPESLSGSAFVLFLDSRGYRTESSPRCLGFLVRAVSK